MKKQKLKKKNILILINLLFLLGCCVFYGTRLIHFYKIENPKVEDVKSLSDLITLGKNLTDKNDGLYKTKDKYYFKGKNVNNYLSYSGRLFRIISIDEQGFIKLITEDLQTSMVWGVDQNYEDSYINSWLNNNSESYKSFLQSLDNTKGLLVNTKTCIDIINDKDIKCDKTYESIVGLPSVYEYNLAGATDSYLNIGKYWWTSNTDKDNKVWYVYKKGSINNDSNNGNTYNIYGVRPTITINGKISNFKGDGTNDNPYEITYNTNKVLNEQYIGSYVTYNNINWIITEKAKDYVKVTTADGLKNKLGEYILTTYGNKNLFSADYGIGYYLNNDFYNSLENKDYILKGEFNNGKYDKTNKYDLTKINEYTEICNVGLLQLGELFINNVDNYYLQSRTITSDNTIYQVLDSGKIYAGNLKEKMKIRPTIYLKPDLKITSGNGTYKDPFKLG